jgi:NADH-quinone oxidoreductase subunit E
MLTPAELHEIDHELHHYEQPAAATIEALKIVQKHRGWVSDEAVADIATRLGTSAAAVDSVATFYNLIYRRPVGRHVIHVCNSVSCYVMGEAKLTECLQRKLGVKMGETTHDGRFTLLPIVCLGTCDHAPAMLVGQDLHRDLESVDDARLEHVLERYK